MIKTFKYSEVKKEIKSFKDNNKNYFDYYKYILINNDQKFHFVNPQKCKSPFNNIHNNIKFAVLKKLIKQGYKLQYLKAINSYILKNNKNYLMYLDYVNNFLTIGNFAEYYSISVVEASKIIDENRSIY